MAKEMYSMSPPGQQRDYFFSVMFKCLEEREASINTLVTPSVSKVSRSSSSSSSVSSSSTASTSSMNVSSNLFLTTPENY